MKNITTLFIAISIGSLLFFSGCKKDDPLPETDRVKGLLAANTWRIQTVIVDGTDQTSLFTGLTLTFTNTSYSTTNGGVVWPASGAWSFSDNTGKRILRSDGQEITVTEVSATVLKLSLTRPKGTLAPGRVSSVAGNHVFTFIK